MARRSIPIEEKIETQKEVVSRAKDRYEAELEKLEKLMKKREELRSKELMEAFERELIFQEAKVMFLLISIYESKNELAGEGTGFSVLFCKIKNKTCKLVM